MDARKGRLEDLILPSPSYAMPCLPFDRIDRVCRALFAGVLSAFILGRFEPDSVNDWIHQAEMMRNSSLGPYEPAEFSLPELIVVAIALFYASLGVTLLAAAIEMLTKRWVREFDHGLQALSIPEQRAETR